MKKFKTYYDWLSESVFNIDEKEIENAVEEELLTKDVYLIQEDTPEFTKLSQIISIEKGTTILQITGHDLVKFDKPFEFIKWNKKGTDIILETLFIVKTEDIHKI